MTHASFSLHAGVAVRADDRGTLERLCRYITRPALATRRLALTPQGQVRYTLKTPYRDGTTPVIFESLDLIAHQGFCSAYTQPFDVTNCSPI